MKIAHTCILVKDEQDRLVSKITLGDKTYHVEVKELTDELYEGNYSTLTLTHDTDWMHS